MSTLFALIVVLAILMTIVGGETGIRSFFSVLINTILLILVAMLISWGINIAILTLIFIPLKLVTIIFLGTHDYTVAKNSFYSSFLVCLIISLFIFGLSIPGSSCRTRTRGRRVIGWLVADAGLELSDDCRDSGDFLNFGCNRGSRGSNEFGLARNQEA